jgi:hypothetical protein
MNNFVVDATDENVRARLVELGLPMPDVLGIFPPQHILELIQALTKGKRVIVRRTETPNGVVHVSNIEGDKHSSLYFIPFK